MIMVTLVRQNNNSIRMTMNQGQSFTIVPPVNIATLKLQVRKRKTPLITRRRAAASGDVVVCTSNSVPLLKDH